MSLVSDMLISVSVKYPGEMFNENFNLEPRDLPANIRGS